MKHFYEKLHEGKIKHLEVNSLYSKVLDILKFKVLEELKYMDSKLAHRMRNGAPMKETAAFFHAERELLQVAIYELWKEGKVKSTCEIWNVPISRRIEPDKECINKTFGIIHARKAK